MRGDTIQQTPNGARDPEHLVNDPPIGVGRVNVPAPPPEPGLAAPEHEGAAAHRIGLQFLVLGDEGVPRLPRDLIPPILAPALSPCDVDVVPDRLPAASPCSIHILLSYPGVWQISSLDHPSHVPASSRLRLSGSTMDHPLRFGL